MKADKRNVAYKYLRLSDDDIQRGESGSITNQRRIIDDYCAQNNIILIGEFVDDGWSGGNFERPGFQNMMKELRKGKANLVITKDLSRLGRDMRESSYYAEQFFPENGIRYIAISDNFDTEKENIMAPFQFAMNEVYLRDGSRKVKDALKSMRENGLYCACPPYGYKKDEKNKNLLVPDENTAPIVTRIFKQAAKGDSSKKIALDLTNDMIIPPLKYRVFYRDNFCDDGAKRASDIWNHTTVKRILKNQVYLGHTILGKTKKVSIKSKKKINVAKEDWATTFNTHQPLVSKDIFEEAQKNMRKGTKKYQDCEGYRKSIFAGIIFCSKCGHALCSCGSVYKGDRYKYWHLSCTQQRKDALVPCSGVRIRYSDLMEVVKNELNELIKLNKTEVKELVEEIINSKESADNISFKKQQIEKANSRLSIIDKIIPKLYTDNAEGRISDARFNQMMTDLEKESLELKKQIEKMREVESIEDTKNDFDKFFSIAKQFTHIENLDRETLLAFVDRIEIGEKIFPEGIKKDIHHKHPFTQEIRIFYKFIGNLQNDNIVKFA